MSATISAVLFVASVIFAICFGRTGDVCAAFLSGAQDAVTFCIKICGSICFFSGIMKVAENCGILRSFSKRIRPVIRRLMPQSAANEETEADICVNIASNMLGLGNAATPSGIKAAKGLYSAGKSNTISRSLAVFIILNTSSIQLFPTTIAAIRESFGAADPFDVILPILITQTLTCAVGLCLVKLLWRNDGDGIDFADNRHKRDMYRPDKENRRFGSIYGGGKGRTTHNG